MEIETAHLLLRKFTPDDFEAMYALWTDGEAMRYVQPDGWPHTREESRGILRRAIEFFEQHGFGQWAVIYKETGRMIGYCGLKFLNDVPEVELLYGVSKEFWNRGLVTEAARASLRYGFEVAGMEKIVAVALPENAGSWRVMEKCGMRREGLSSHKGYEVVRYTISRDEFEPGDAPYLFRPHTGDARESNDA